MTQQQKIIAIALLSGVLVFVSVDSYKKIQKKKPGKKTQEQIEQELKAKQAKTPAGITPPPSVIPAAVKEQAAAQNRALRESQKTADVDGQKKIAEGEWVKNPFFDEDWGSGKNPPEGKGPDENPVEIVVPVQNLQEEVMASMKLEGVSVAGKALMAVINRKILREGETFSTDKGTFKVKKIEKDRVLLEANGGVYELSLKK
jgi:hypothetical protein